MFEQAPLLSVAHLQRRFGGLTAVSDVDLEVNAGEMVGIIGPNGAGKTTLFNLLVGALRPDQGRVWLNDTDITGLPPHRVFHHGLARTFQLTRPFAELSVLDNLLIAPRGQLGERFWANWLRRGRVAREERALRDEVED